MSLNFIIKNLSQINLNSDKIKVLLEKYISKYDDKYSLSLAQHHSEYSLCNADFLYKISKLNNDKFSKSTNLNQPILGSSLYAFGHMLSFIDYHYRINWLNILKAIRWASTGVLVIISFLLLRIVLPAFINDVDIAQDIGEDFFTVAKFYLNS